MEVRDWIMLVSAIIVVAGWFWTAHLNRKNEIAKKTMEYRLEMLHSLYPILDVIEGKSSSDLITVVEYARRKFLLYGLEDEVKAFEDFIAQWLAVSKKSPGSRISFDGDIVNAMNALCHIVVTRIREELRLCKINHHEITGRL